jgi:hypothetical protein
MISFTKLLQRWTLVLGAAGIMSAGTLRAADETAPAAPPPEDKKTEKSAEEKAPDPAKEALKTSKAAYEKARKEAMKDPEVMAAFKAANEALYRKAVEIDSEAQPYVDAMITKASGAKSEAAAKTEPKKKDPAPAGDAKKKGDQAADAKGKAPKSDTAKKN